MQRKRRETFASPKGLCFVQNHPLTIFTTRGSFSLDAMMRYKNLVFSRVWCPLHSIKRKRETFASPKGF